jgi:hypothetical protein
MKNPYPVSPETAERQGGGNTPVTGEAHDQPKARRIPAERRYSEADNATLENSPGRASSDVRDRRP